MCAFGMTVGKSGVCLLKTGLNQSSPSLALDSLISMVDFATPVLLAKLRLCKQEFGGKTSGNQSLVRHRHRWEDNIKMGIKGIGWKDVDCIYVAQLKGF
jgi:hypothetical protein